MISNSSRLDAIAAVTTAPGRGGIGIVRVSGKHLQPLIAELLHKSITPRHAARADFFSAHGEIIDTGIALYFPAPHSYTGEDVVELQGHGGPVVLRLLLQRCLELGARVATPGEFTSRAFLNGKLDLAQAEAVADLIEATTEKAASYAMRSLQGEFSSAIDALVTALTELRLLVEATLDFPEEEVDFLKTAQARERVEKLHQLLADIYARSKQGALLREGLRIVLAGQPNVGKSSLLNQLAGQELAIVTPIAGTTRDAVRETIAIEGIPLHIIDTAGLRDTKDEVESIGIARTWAEIEKADVVLLIVDARMGVTETDLAIVAKLPTTLKILTVFNKIDLVNVEANRREQRGKVEIKLSAKTAAGIKLLRSELLKIAGWHTNEEGLFMARERHLQALNQAQQHLTWAKEVKIEKGMGLELFAEELRLAQNALSEITGEVTADDLLGKIFSRFCIGK